MASTVHSGSPACCGSYALPEKFRLTKDGKVQKLCFNAMERPDLMVDEVAAPQSQFWYTISKRLLSFTGFAGLMERMEEVALAL